MQEGYKEESGSVSFKDCPGSGKKPSVVKVDAVDRGVCPICNRSLKINRLGRLQRHNPMGVPRDTPPQGINYYKLQDERNSLREQNAALTNKVAALERAIFRQENGLKLLKDISEPEEAREQEAGNPELEQQIRRALRISNEEEILAACERYMSALDAAYTKLGQAEGRAEAYQLDAQLKQEHFTAMLLQWRDIVRERDRIKSGLNKAMEFIGSLRAGFARGVDPTQWVIGVNKALAEFLGEGH